MGRGPRSRWAAGVGAGSTLTTPSRRARTWIADHASVFWAFGAGLFISSRLGYAGGIFVKSASAVLAILGGAIVVAALASVLTRPRDETDNDV
jgi:hypothetical protein